MLFTFYSPLIHTVIHSVRADAWPDQAVGFGGEPGAAAMGRAEFSSAGTGTEATTGLGGVSLCLTVLTILRILFAAGFFFGVARDLDLTVTRALVFFALAGFVPFTDFFFALASLRLAFCRTSCASAARLPARLASFLACLAHFLAIFSFWRA